MIDNNVPAQAAVIITTRHHLTIHARVSYSEALGYDGEGIKRDMASYYGKSEHEDAAQSLIDEFGWDGVVVSVAPHPRQDDVYVHTFCFTMREVL